MTFFKTWSGRRFWKRAMFWRRYPEILVIRSIEFTCLPLIVFRPVPIALLWLEVWSDQINRFLANSRCMSTIPQSSPGTPHHVTRLIGDLVLMQKGLRAVFDMSTKKSASHASVLMFSTIENVLGWLPSVLQMCPDATTCMSLKHANDHLTIKPQFCWTCLDFIGNWSHSDADNGISLLHAMFSFEVISTDAEGNFYQMLCIDLFRVFLSLVHVKRSIPFRFLLRT